MKVPKMSEVFRTLKKTYEMNLLSEGNWMLEMPHWDFGGVSVMGRTYNMVDFQIEKYPISSDEKKRLVHAFITIGFVGKTSSGQHVFFSNGAKGQPEIAHATTEQVESCPHLPDGWEKFLREA